jgi:hypothetical protein
MIATISIQNTAEFEGFVAQALFSPWFWICLLGKTSRSEVPANGA